jgi:hypothetical protein
MAARPLPSLATPVVDPKTGMMAQVWFEYFQGLQIFQSLSQLRDVSTTAPTNGQVLTWNSTTKLWTPSAN